MRWTVCLLTGLALAGCQVAKGPGESGRVVYYEPALEGARGGPAMVLPQPR